MSGELEHLEGTLGSIFPHPQGIQHMLKLLNYQLLASLGKASIMDAWLYVI